MKRRFAMGVKFGAIMILVAQLTACVGLPDRLGPSVEADMPAPFLSAAGHYPTQRQVNSAIGLSIEEHGLGAVYSSFGAAAGDRAPNWVALFACKPGFYRPGANAVEPRSGYVHCHVDVMDARDRLIGRATMSFYSDVGGWRLAGVRERDFGAR